MRTSLLAIGFTAATAFAAPSALQLRQDAPPADWYESGRAAGESSQCRYETRMKDWCGQTLERFKIDAIYGAYGNNYEGTTNALPAGECATQDMGLRGVSVGCKIFFASGNETEGGGEGCWGSGQNIKDGVGQIRGNGMDVCGIKHFTGWRKDGTPNPDCALKIDYLDGGC